jgi:hypothetical protein
VPALVPPLACRRSSAPTHRDFADALPVPGPGIPGADGLLIDGKRLVVVSFAGLTLLTLDDDTPTTTTAGKIEDPSFRSPSTVAKADGRYIVVNADFSKSRSPFTVSSVAI